MVVLLTTCDPEFAGHIVQVGVPVLEYCPVTQSAYV
jgi:hypothetical protein